MDADAVAHVSRNPVLPELSHDGSTNHEHRPRLRRPHRLHATRRIVARSQHMRPPLGVDEKHTVRLHMKIARSRLLIERMALTTVRNEKADRCAARVEHSGVHRKAHALSVDEAAPCQRLEATERAPLLIGPDQRDLIARGSIGADGKCAPLKAPQLARTDPAIGEH